MKKDKVSEHRVTVDTPSPSWLESMDVDAAEYVEELLETDIVRDSLNGQIDEVEVQKFLLQIGNCLIKPFAFWLDNLMKKAARGSAAYTFLRLNRAEESHHWVWWYEMAAKWGLSVADFDNVRLRPSCYELYYVLTELSLDAPLCVAITGINYVIETGSAQVTSLVAPALLPQMTEEQALWLQAHAGGDPYHALDARELIKELEPGFTESPALLGPKDFVTPAHFANVMMTMEMRRVMAQVYELFIRAMRDSYRSQRESVSLNRDVA